MPYIKKDARLEIDNGRLPDTAGELNYIFTKVILRYLGLKGPSYQAFNDIIGALEGAKLELYRRAVGAYEDKKISENGDVYK